MHVLGLPPAFVLSQDQTLKFDLVPQRRPKPTGLHQPAQPPQRPRTNRHRHPPGLSPYTDPTQDADARLGPPADTAPGVTPRNAPTGAPSRNACPCPSCPAQYPEPDTRPPTKHPLQLLSTLSNNRPAAGVPVTREPGVYAPPPALSNPFFRQFVDRWHANYAEISTG